MQSTAMLVLAAQGKIKPRLFIFANVGQDSEHPDSLAYFRDVAIPFAAANGIEMVEVQKRWKRGDRAGTTDTLRSALSRGQRSIPFRKTKDGPPMGRSCTVDFKLGPIGDELRRRGATAEAPALVSLGISVDEIERANPGADERSPWQVRTYPLLDLGMRRVDCLALIRDAGLPEPGKSSCFFCPYHSIEAWRLLRARTPELFAESVAIEAALSTTAHPVYLTRHGKPLSDVLDDQLTFDGMDGCESGWCFT